MRKIIIKSQKQFDKLPKSFKEPTEIYIEGKIYAIEKNIDSGIYIVWGNAIIQDVRGNAIIQDVRDNAIIQDVWGNAIIQDVRGNAIIQYVWGNATIQYVRGNATIQDVRGNAIIQYVWGNAIIQYVWGNATIQDVRDNAIIQYVRDNAIIQYVWGNATIQYVRGNAIIQDVRDNATIQDVRDNAIIQDVRGNAIIQDVRDNAIIQYVRGNATIKLFGGKVNRASKDVIIICQDYKPKLDVLAQVIYTKKATYSKKDFIELYGSGKDIITLYKSVNSETELDFYTNTIKYEDGAILKPKKWNRDTSIECGEGLHLCPTPQLTQIFNKGKIKICEVNIKDFVVYPHNISKVRCKKVKVIGDYKKEK